MLELWQVTQPTNEALSSWQLPSKTNPCPRMEWSGHTGSTRLRRPTLRWLARSLYWRRCWSRSLATRCQAGQQAPQGTTHPSWVVGQPHWEKQRLPTRTQTNLELLRRSGRTRCQQGSPMSKRLTMILAQRPPRDVFFSTLAPSE